MMIEIPHTEPLEGAEDAPPRYASFILRCRVGSGGQVYGRLFDVRSGTSCPIGDLDDLPGILRRLIRDAFVGQEEP